MIRLISGPQILIIDPGIKCAEVECFEWISEEALQLKMQLKISESAHVDQHPLSPLCSYHLPALKGVESLYQVQWEEILGVIILGSGASPKDTLIWQDQLSTWLKELFLLQLPILGLCYGHQLLAHLFGASVELLWGGERASGLRWVDLKKGGFWGEEQRGELVVSHREGVCDIPRGWRSIAHSSLIPEAIEAMEHTQSPWWGFQAHIEATEAFLSNNRVDTPHLPTPYLGHILVSSFLRGCLSGSLRGYSSDHFKNALFRPDPLSSSDRASNSKKNLAHSKKNLAQRTLSQS